MRVVSFAPTLIAASALACASCANSKFWNRGGSPPAEPESAEVTTPEMPEAAAADNASSPDKPSIPNKPSKPDEKPKPPVVVDDRLRLPDMLSLPSERELHRPQPQIADDEATGITARPPVVPPERKDD